jgi:hypothetical protein
MSKSSVACLRYVGSARRKKEKNVFVDEKRQALSQTTDEIVGFKEESYMKPREVMIGKFSCKTQKDTLHFLACSPFSGSKNRHRANTRKVLGPGCRRPHVLGNAISPLVRHQSQKLSFKLKLVGREVVSWSGKTISGPLTCALVKLAAQQGHSDINTKEKPKDNQNQERTTASENKYMKPR